MNGVQTSQLFITTHSPYVLQDLDVNRSHIIIFPEGKTIYQLPTFLGNRPSLGVVNYHAYKLPTVELHDELYSYIHDKAANDPRYESITGFDDYLNSGGIPKDKTWTKETMGKTSLQSVTLPTLIRNRIHHPENKTMRTYDYTPDL